MGDIYRETTKNVPQAKSEALNLIVGMVFRKSLEKMNKRMLPLSKRSKGFSKKLELCKNETRQGGGLPFRKSLSILGTRSSYGLLKLNKLAVKKGIQHNGNPKLRFLSKKVSMPHLRQRVF